MSFSALIEDLHKAQSTAFKEVTLDTSIAQDCNEIVQTIIDMSKCADALTHRYEADLYELAIKEIQFSLLAALGASYRQAFMGLRLGLEHWFAGIHYSSNEFNFRKWQLGERDASWSELNNKDSGILSEQFAHVFWPNTEQRIATYRNVAGNVYRECSEYVHGNPKTHIDLPKQLQYNRNSFLSWKEKLDTIRMLFVYTFVIRFGSTLNPNDLESISQVILDAIGHLNEARNLLKGD